MPDHAQLATALRRLEEYGERAAQLIEGTPGREVVSARDSPGVDDRGSMSAEWPLVKAGAKGGAVKALQRLLLHRGSELEVDGSFGPDTEKALEAFQSANGLDADGVAGTKTWSKLVVPVRSGQRGEPVLAVQELLGVGADGTFGPDTEKATRRFQKRVHLAVDGIVGPHTWQLLIVES